MKKILSGSLLAPMGLIIIMNLLVVHNASGQIAVRGTSTASSTNSNLVINKPSGVVSGDVMILNLDKYNTNTTPSLSGWTLVAGPATLTSGSSNFGFVLYRVADGTEGTSFTFALGTNSFCSGTIVAFSGVDGIGGFKADGTAGGPFDVDPGSISASTASVSSLAITAITTVTANAAVVMFGMSGGTSTSPPSFSTWSTTSPGTLTEIYDNNGGASVPYIQTGAAWGTKATPGTTGPTGSITLTGSNNLGGILIALRPKCSAAAPTVTTPVKLCLNGPSSPLTATGSNLLWYTQPTGGTGSSTAPTPSTSALGSTSYYVSQTIGCESPRSQIVVTVNGLPTAAVTGQTNISCFGANDGTITVSGSGGTSPYTFSINNGSNFLSATGTNLRLFTGLAPNNAYRIKVKDSNGCISK